MKDCRGSENRLGGVARAIANPMKTIARILLCVAAAFVLNTTTHAAETVVYVNGEAAGLAGRFSKAKRAYTFTRVPDGIFVRAQPTKYAALKVPNSILKDRNEHKVEVGIVVSPKGEVTDVAVIASNSKTLEVAACTMAAAFRFRAASLNGKPVWSLIILPVTYKYVDPEELRKRLENSQPPR